MAAKKRVFVGLMSELVLIHEDEDKQDEVFMELAKEWHEKGYTICSGSVTEGKVDEIWAIEKEDYMT